MLNKSLTMISKNFANQVENDTSCTSRSFRYLRPSLHIKGDYLWDAPRTPKKHKESSNEYECKPTRGAFIVVAVWFGVNMSL